MSNTALELLPPRIAALSISQKEIVLPLEEALLVIDIMESKGIPILGWEGWVKTDDGRVGHGSAPQGTESLEGLSVGEAAALCRRSMQQDAAQWAKEHEDATEELHFCITVCA